MNTLITKTHACLVLFIFFSIISNYHFVQAYPELTRFHYNTCTACHVSPSGGGLITPYGRKLSQEVLTTWGTESEAAFLHGSINSEKLDEWLLMGGDMREAQVHTEDNNVIKERFIPMQFNFNVATFYKDWTGYLALGEIKNNKWKLEPDTAYIMWRPQDEWSIRAGKFTPQYGIILPDHILYIRSYLGLGLESTRSTFEIQKNGEAWIENLSFSKQNEDQGGESAISGQVQFYFNDSNKIAVNAWQGKTASTNRSIVGFWGLLSYQKNLFWLAEFDLQNNKLDSASTQSNVHYNKLGYTIHKGLDLFIHEEAMQTNLSESQSLTTRRGLGMQFFPRPHFDFQGVFTKQVVNSNPKLESDYAWFILHYYL